MSFYLHEVLDCDYGRFGTGSMKCPSHLGQIVHIRYTGENHNRMHIYVGFEGSGNFFR